MDMTKLKNAFDVAVEAAKSAAEGSDRAPFDRAMKDVRAEIAALENTDGGSELEGLRSTVEQLRADVDQATKAVREVRKAGLGIGGDGRIVVPQGRAARMQMLADGRAWMDDRTAHRYGAYIAYAATRMHPKWAESDLPDYVRGLGKDIFEAQGQVRGGILMGKDVSMDFDVDVDADGAYLFPDEFRGELIRNVEAVGRVYTLMRRVPLLEGSSIKWPKRTGGLTAYPTAAGAAIQQSAMTFDLVTLTAEKLGVLVGVPNEFLRNTSLLADLGQLLATEIIYALASKIDDCAVNGDGTDDYAGVTGILESGNLSVVTLSSHDSGATVDETDIDDIEEGLGYEYALENARWLMSLSMVKHIKNLRTTTGASALIWDRGDGVGGQMPPTINGYPYTISNKFPAVGGIGASEEFCAFGDLRMSHFLGMVRDVMLATSEHAAFGQDATLFRGLASFDIQEQDATATVVGKTHS